MGRLEQIAAANPDPSGERAREKAAAEFDKRMREQKALARGKEGAMRYSAPILGQVIFPGRWSAEQGFDRTYGKHVRCVARWHGFRLVCLYWGSNDRGWPTAQLTIERAGEDAQKIDSQAALAAVLRDWKVI